MTELGQVFSSARKIKPTQKHRLALVPGILGTVYGVSPEGECRYFDYNLDAALAFAIGGLPLTGLDPRWSVPAAARSYIRSGATEQNPRRGTKCLWVASA